MSKMARDNEYHKFLELQARAEANRPDEDLYADICEYQDYAVDTDNSSLFDELEILRIRIGSVTFPD